MDARQQRSRDMTDQTREPLELSISNLGPIESANIELRPLTVFVGPSNTGKSYAATLIYALHNFFTDYASRARPYPATDMSQDDIDRIHEWVNSALPRVAIEGNAKCLSHEMPDAIAKVVNQSLRDVARLSEPLSYEVAGCFGVADASNLIRYPYGGKSLFAIRGSAPGEYGRDKRFQHEMELADEDTRLTSSTPEMAFARINTDRWHIWHLQSLTEEFQVGKEEAARALIFDIARESVSRMVRQFSHPAHYLPADRGGVMHAHQAAVRGAIASASRVGLRPDPPEPMISGALGDFLQCLIDLAEPRYRRGDANNVLAQRIEKLLMRGEARVEESPPGYPSFFFRPDGWERDLPLLNASSMVSEIAPVVLYLRHLVQPGDLLIIEEPESHLHPAMQVQFIRLLAAAVQDGVRILITTHSEWVLEELANLVKMSALPDDKRERLDDPEIFLRPDQAGVWLFERGGETGGANVREIELDDDISSFPAGFTLITEGLYNRWVDIDSRTQDWNVHDSG